MDFKKIFSIIFILLLLFVPAFSVGSVSKVQEDSIDDKFKFFGIVFLILAIFGLVFMLFGIYYFGLMILAVDLVLVAFTVARYFITLT